ncbi:hypothetical protein I3679_009845 [Proteus mirabilis]|uniref:Phage protein n=1 Tax=Proteus mirabilis TaxID=584 RepID=A0ABD5LUT3_PROMI
MVDLAEVEIKYGFPLFSKPSSVVNLGKNEKIVISDIWAFWDYVIKKRVMIVKERIFKVTSRTGKTLLYNSGN